MTILAALAWPLLGLALRLILLGIIVAERNHGRISNQG